ncbi:phospholipid carrier-dependent glycosyltransferase [Plantactinospora sp. B6F1]|uniref:phospholipid carrier-dependent glycosyltransferase n=1 Tax=Plantactinospora sp. B6F1 TaxID=3158971 RepID=UPI0032D93F2F
MRSPTDPDSAATPVPGRAAPTTSGDQPPAADEQPATSVEQPATGQEQPATSAEHSSTGQEQPATAGKGAADGGSAPGRFGGLRRHRRWLLPLVVVLLLAQMAAAMLSTAVQQTPTIDEPVYVGTAMVYLREDSLRYNFEHPPLGKLIIGTGLLFADAHFDPAFTGDQGAVGRHLLYESGNDPGRLMLLARLPMILLTLLFGLVVYVFAADLVGRVGGLAALALYAFSPDVIAHGSLATLDVPAAGFLLTSAWLLWRARRRPLRYLPLAATALGAALATRMSALAAVPVLLLLAVLSVWSAAGGGKRRDPRGRVRLLGLGVAAATGVGLVAVAVVWATYLVVDPRLSWVTPENLRAVHGLRGMVLDWLPLPRPYLDGMRFQFQIEDKTLAWAWRSRT